MFLCHRSCPFIVGWMCAVKSPVDLSLLMAWCTSRLRLARCSVSRASSLISTPKYLILETDSIMMLSNSSSSCQESSINSVFLRLIFPLNIICCCRANLVVLINSTSSAYATMSSLIPPALSPKD
ncbi:hypothetical protein BpHYR1_003260 [Brachionus plicatilis]|uniref:Uncharacterized protein n=1 Tax=Brachionus plicatilis TaxID=10195 RepID=A0A3M7QRE0_BRAPC|nr:hypothetical protein BpHYR1_003260 [Brachionus plicatilis]